MLQQGLSVNEISLRSGYSNSGVHKLLQQLGLTIPDPVGNQPTHEPTRLSP